MIDTGITNSIPFSHFSLLLERELRERKKEKHKEKKEGFIFFLEFQDSLWRCLILLWAFKFLRFLSLFHSFFPFHPINPFVSSTNHSKLIPLTKNKKPTKNVVFVCHNHNTLFFNSFLCFYWFWCLTHSQTRVWFHSFCFKHLEFI